MKHMPKIKDVMSAFPFSINAGDTIRQARSLMKEHHVGHLPVNLEDGSLSVISLRELDRTQLPGHSHTDFDELTMGDLCPVNTFQVDLQTSLIEVLDHMSDTHTDCALVTRNNKLVGVFTFSDACHAFSEHLKEIYFPPSGHDVA